MKKKIFSILLIAVMVLSSFSAAFAADTGKITISNAAKGETYSIVKVFDAKHADGVVNYYGTIPTELEDYFEKQPGTENGVKLKDNVNEEALSKALQTWAEKQTIPDANKKEADGGAVVFDNIPFGYYVVLTTQGAGKATITSANPEATVIDKNTSEPSLSKTIDDDNVTIGDTVTYTVVADAPNYLDGTKKVVSYQFKDTLPAFIDNVKIQSIVVTDGDGDHTVVGPNANKDWESGVLEAITWVNDEGDHIYKNDAKITIIYTAEITGQASEGSAGEGNVNIITMIPKVEKPEGGYEDYEKEWKDEAVTRTYAAALIKTNEAGKKLPNAKFAVKGLTVTEIAVGEYKVVSYDPTATTYGTEMTTGADGTIIIHGLASDVSLTAMETEAPEGYNKLDGTFTLTPQIVSKEIIRTNTIQYFDSAEKGKCHTDEDWQAYLKNTVVTEEKITEEYNTDLVAASAANTVINKEGTVMPETGGMGTTIIYILGAALVIGAGVVLVSRKRSNDR